MPRLYRPHIPLEVRCLVATRQLEHNDFLLRLVEASYEGRLRNFLDHLLGRLATKFGCKVKDLRLDHDPPLAARPFMHKRKTGTVVYKPDANDPDHLFYRPHGTQFDGSHDVKTRIRGDHGQYSDVALIKRERRRRQKKAKGVQPLKRHVANRGKNKVSSLTSCMIGARCFCVGIRRKGRKRCGNWRTAKIGGRR